MKEDWCENCAKIGCRVRQGRCAWVRSKHFTPEWDALRADDKYAWATLKALIKESESPTGLPGNHTFDLRSAQGCAIGELKATGTTNRSGKVWLHRLYYGQPDAPEDQVVALTVQRKRPGRGAAAIAQNGHIAHAVKRFFSWSNGTE